MFIRTASEGEDDLGLGQKLLSPAGKTPGKDLSPSGHKCDSHSHQHGQCHGFDVHKGGKWLVAHGDFDINDSGATADDIDLRKRKEDMKMLGGSIAVMFSVMSLELCCGFALGSLALLSDGLHYASDVALYSCLLFSVVISARKENLADYSFGYHRSQILGALIALLLQYFFISLLIFIAVQRLTVRPHYVWGPGISGVGLVSLLANLSTLYLLPGSSSGHGHSHGAASGSEADAAGVARLHMLGDLAQGSTVICVGIVTWIWPECTWADPASAFVYAAVVLASSWRVFQDLLVTLMERAPMELDVQGLFDDLSKLKGVIDVHCYHVWALAPEKVAMSAHLHIEDDKHEEVLHAAQIVVKHKYGINHSTLQISEDEDLA